MTVQFVFEENTYWHAATGTLTAEFYRGVMDPTTGFRVEFIRIDGEFQGIRDTIDNECFPM